MRIKKKYSRKRIQKSRKHAERGRKHTRRGRKHTRRGRKHTRRGRKHTGRSHKHTRKVEGGGYLLSPRGVMQALNKSKNWLESKKSKDLRFFVSHDPVRYVIPFVYNNRVFLMFFKYNGKNVKSVIQKGQLLEYKGLMLLADKEDNIKVLENDNNNELHTNPGNPINKAFNSKQFSLKCSLGRHCKIKQRKGDILIKNFKWISKQCNNNVIDYGSDSQAKSKGGLKDKFVLFARPDGETASSTLTQNNDLEGMEHQQIIKYLTQFLNPEQTSELPHVVYEQTKSNMLIESLKQSLEKYKYTISLHMRNLGIIYKEDVDLLAYILEFEKGLKTSFDYVDPYKQIEADALQSYENPSIYLATCFTLAKFPMWCETYDPSPIPLYLKWTDMEKSVEIFDEFNNAILTKDKNITLQEFLKTIKGELHVYKKFEVTNKGGFQSVSGTTLQPKNMPEKIFIYLKSKGKCYIEFTINLNDWKRYITRFLSRQAGGTNFATIVQQSREATAKVAQQPTEKEQQKVLERRETMAKEQTKEYHAQQEQQKALTEREYQRTFDKLPTEGINSDHPEKIYLYISVGADDNPTTKNLYDYKEDNLVSQLLRSSEPNIPPSLLEEDCTMRPPEMVDQGEFKPTEVPIPSSISQSVFR